MISSAILAFGASTALGCGEDALGVPRLHDPPRCALGVDDELLAAGLHRPHAGRSTGLGSPVRSPGAHGEDRATTLLSRAFAACARGLDDELPDWRARRVGLALGTSSGGMRTFEELLDEVSPRSPDGFIEGTYLGPLVASLRPVVFSPSTLVLGACASSTLALGLARAWLAEGACDLVLAGGYDALSVFVAAGFEALRATSRMAQPRPFRADRDGLVLGEGAALLAMVRADDPVLRTSQVFGFVRGFGASCDAVHVTAPDRSGHGLAQAARAALEDAGHPSVDIVSAHGTATVFNDAAEGLAIRATLGEGPTLVHAFKSSIGHTLGAAGAVETLAILGCVRAGIAPASGGDGPIEPWLSIPPRAEARELETALKLSAAFGGANAALVVSKTDASLRAASEREVSPEGSSALTTRASRTAYLSDVVALTGDLGEMLEPSWLASRTGVAIDRIARTDDLTRLTMAAVVSLARARDVERPKLSGAGLIVGHGLATFDTNAAHQASISKAGAALAGPRRFPYTSPNACVGEAAIAFGLTGPAFAVGGGPHGGIEALAAAATLVRAGHADRVVVVAVDAAGAAVRRFAPDTPRGAVAFVVESSRGDAVVEDAAVRLDQEPRRPLPNLASVAAHPALLGLLAAEGDRTQLVARSPWGLSATATVRWLSFAPSLESRFMQRC